MYASSLTCEDVQDLHCTNPSDNSCHIQNKCWNSDSHVADDTTWPCCYSKIERAIVVDDFLRLHRANIERAIDLLRRAMRQRNLKDLDPERDALALTFGFRAHTCCASGNPATQLFLQAVDHLEIGVAAGGHALVQGRAYEAYEATDGHHHEACACVRAGAEREPMLTVFCHAGGIDNCLSVPLRPISMDKASEADLISKDWITHLRVVTTAGMFYATDVDTGEKDVRSILQKEGKEWKWARMPKDQWERVRDKRWRYMGPEPDVCLDKLPGIGRRK